MDDDSVSAVAVNAPENLKAFFDRVLDSAPDEPGPAYQHFEEALQQLDRFSQEPEFPVVRSLVVGLCLQNQGAYAVSTADFGTAAVVLEQASDEFAQAGVTNWADVCKGLQMVAQANVELRQQNFGAGQKLITDAQRLLAKDPRLSLKYAPLIDDITCGSLGLGTLQAAQMMNFSEAQVLSEAASTKAEAFAHKYLTEGTPMHFYYLGMAKLWRACFQFFKAQSDFGAFSFQDMLAEGDLARTAREARALLTQAAGLAIAADAYNLSGAFCGMLEVLPSAAKLASALLYGQPTPRVDYTTLQAHLGAAKDAAAAGGKSALSLFRFCERFAEMIGNLRKFDLDRPKPIARPADPNSPIHIFIIMPFAEQSKIVEQALRAVLEDDPYWFKITLARDSTLAPNLLDNVKAHMYLADAFLADISGLNPNVMMELGMVESDPAQRPVFVLKRQVDKKDKKEADVPSDLKGRLYVEYGLVATASSEEKVRLLVNDLRTRLSSLSELTGLTSRSHTRYTSAQYIERKLQEKKMRLSPEEVASLQKSFPSLEEFESATPKQVVLKTGFDEDIARAVMNAFSANNGAAAASQAGSP
ncbi:MAG: hypothetical protein JO033_11250 [Acidobacteriaceae bacterium]|nr:hypothetical protein [Acidobacteriaceae bacterium]MBV9503014.1 hypothetical protein [Acidobacteriaceae bacterium]